MKFHVEIHEFSCIRIKNNNLKFISLIHEIPGRTSWNFHGKKITINKNKTKKFHATSGGTSWQFNGFFFDQELRKILV